jgi:hypothetical protein
MPYKQSKYDRYRQKNPKDFKEDSFRTVPLNHTQYRGKKFEDYMYSRTSAKAIVGKLKKSNEWSIQSILILKR